MQRTQSCVPWPGQSGRQRETGGIRFPLFLLREVRNGSFIVPCSPYRHRAPAYGTLLGPDATEVIRSTGTRFPGREAHLRPYAHGERFHTFLFAVSFHIGVRMWSIIFFYDKKILCVVVVAGCLSACEDRFERGGGEKGGATTIQLRKLDFDGAKSLFLTEEPNRSQADADVSEAGLFKIDEAGNVSAVVLSCTEMQDGTVVRVRNDIRIIPGDLISLSGAYTVMRDCSFLTEDGAYLDMASYYDRVQCLSLCSCGIRTERYSIFRRLQRSNISGIYTVRHRTIKATCMRYPTII